MPKTFLQLKTAVEATTGSDASTGDRVNNGQLELAKLTQKITRANIAITNGVGPLPADCLIPRAVSWEGVELDRWDSDSLPTYYGNGTPTWWLSDGTNLLLFPKATSGTAALAYTKRPATMSNDADLPELQDADQAIIAYAKWQYYVDNEDDEEAGFWEEQWAKEAASWLDLDRKRFRRPVRVKALPYR